EGAVIRPAEPVLSIVPDETRLVVDAAIAPTSIDQVFPGQEARLRFSAFNARTTPEIGGVLRRVSPDALTDEATGQSYYAAEVTLTEEGLAELEDLTLVAGMPVEVFLQTGERTPISYLVRPFTDYFARSMRED
ncbi:MAG: HlyD family efflux transporter periplasmic adaptor subunit, partial [Rhodobacteraceae bacterium]